MKKVARAGGRWLVAVLALALAWEAAVEILGGIGHFPTHPSFRFFWPALEPLMASVVGLFGEAAGVAACLLALILFWKLPGDRGARTLAFRSR